MRLTATATNAYGQVVSGVEFVWASGNTAVAVVDTSGLVTGVGAGEVQVTATTAEITGRGELTIVAPVPTTIAVTPDSVVLIALGHSTQLTAEVRDQAGRAMEGIPVAWSSADTTVAVVDSSGLVGAVSNGAVTVTATAGEAAGEARVTVMQSAGLVTVSPSVDTVSPGDTLRLVAEAYDENGHVVEGAVFMWSSSDAPVATVDPSGLVRGAGEGHGDDHGHGGRCLGDVRDHRGQSRPGGAGGVVQRDGWSELGRQHQLADGCAAGGVVWGEHGCCGSGGSAPPEREMGP